MALSLAASACGSALARPVASVGSATLESAHLQAILDSEAAADDGTVAMQTAARHISKWILSESWIDLAEAGGTELRDTHLELARSEFQQARASEPTLPEVDSPHGRIEVRYLAVSHLIADHVAAAVEVTALCSSHLLVPTRDEARQAIARLDAGEDFAAVAMDVSVGPSAPLGGDLGCAAPASFAIAEFVDGAAAVGGSGVSAPVESQFGWHVINVRSFGPVVRGRHDELTSAQITNFVLANHQSELVRLQAELFEREISVDPRFGHFDPAAGAVVAGPAPS